MAKLKGGSRVYGNLTVDDVLILSAGATINGNLVVTGTTTTVNSDVSYVKDPLIEIGGGANAAALTVADGKDRGTLLHYYDATAGAVDAFMGWDASGKEFAFGSNVTNVGDTVTFNTYGNLHANHFIGQGDLLGNITGANVTGTVAYANMSSYAGLVVGNAQPNITSVGTLTSVSVTGTATAGNLSTAGTLAAGDTTITGNTSVSGNLTVTGTISGSINATITAKGADTNIQFNDGGTINGVAGLSFAKSTNTLSTGNVTATGTVTAATVLATSVGNASTVLTGNGASISAINGGNVSEVALATHVTAADQGNITSVGTLVSLGVTGNITTAAGITATGRVTALSVEVTTANASGAVNVGSLYSGDNITAAQTVSGANISTTGITSTKDFTITGNVTGSLLPAANVTYDLGSSSKAWRDLYLSGSSIKLGSQTITSTSTGVVLSNSISTVDVTASGTVSAATVSATGDVSGATLTGTLTTPAQGNITSVGILTGLTVDGNVNATNIRTDHLLHANGSVWDFNSANGSTGAVQIKGSDGDLLGTTALTFDVASSNLTVTGSVIGGKLATTGTLNAGETSLGATTITGNATVTGDLNVGGVVIANGAITASSFNTVGGISATGDLTANNATISGTLTAGDTVVNGNLTVTGTTTSVNSTVTQLTDPIIELGGGANGAALTANDAMDRGTLMHRRVAGTNVDSFMGWEANTNQMIFGSNVSVSNNVVTVNQYANIKAGSAVFTGDANIVGSLYIGGVTIANGSISAPNFVGNVTGDVSGNISGNITVTGTNGALQFAVGSTLTSSANLNFDVANATLTVGGNSSTGTLSADFVEGTLTTAAQPNVTSVGTLTSLAVDGNVTTGNVSGTTGAFTTVTATTANVTTANVTGTVNAGNVVVGSGSGGSITGANLVSANYLTGTLTTAAQPNVTSVGTLTSLAVDGAVAAGSFMSDVYQYANGAPIDFQTAAGNATEVQFKSSTGNDLAASAAFTFNTASNTLSATNVTATLVTGTLTTAAQPNVTSVGTLTSLAVTGNVAAGNVSATTVTATTVAGTLSTAAQPNVKSLGELTSLTVRGISDLGNTANLVITGGSAGQYLRSNGTGGVEFASVDATMISDGTSSVDVVGTNGNVVVTVAGSEIVKVTGTGANVTGTIAVTGNVNANNITAASSITVTDGAQATSAATGALKVTGGISATGNIYTGHSVGFANNNGGTASAAYIQFNASANSLDFIFN